MTIYYEKNIHIEFSFAEQTAAMFAMSDQMILMVIGWLVSLLLWTLFSPPSQNRPVIIHHRTNKQNTTLSHCNRQI